MSAPTPRVLDRKANAEAEPKPGQIVVALGCHALDLYPGDVIHEPIPSEKTAKVKSKVSAKAEDGTKLREVGTVGQVSLRFNPDYVVVILDNRHRLRYEPTAEVWVTSS